MLIAPHNDVQYSSGTSFAAPYVAGTVALMLERRPDLTPDAIKKTLMMTARDLGPKGVDDQFGAGLIDPYRALLAVAPATVGIGADARAVPAPVVPASVQR
jgi:subtilisin family serine protease